SLSPENQAKLEKYESRAKPVIERPIQWEPSRFQLASPAQPGAADLKLSTQQAAALEQAMERAIVRLIQKAFEETLLPSVLPVQPEWVLHELEDLNFNPTLAHVYDQLYRWATDGEKIAEGIIEKQRIGAAPAVFRWVRENPLSTHTPTGPG